MPVAPCQCSGPAGCGCKCREARCSACAVGAPLARRRPHPREAGPASALSRRFASVSGLLGRCGAACGNPAQALPAAMARCRPQRVSCYDLTARGVAAQALPAAAAHGTAVLAAGDTQVLAAATVGAITDVRNVSTLLGNEAHRLITAFAVPGFATSAVRARPRAECTAHHSVTRAAGRGGLVQSAAADGRSAQQTCLPCDARRGPRSLTSTTLILTRRDTCAPA